MITYIKSACDQVKWWNKQPTDADHTINSFDGKFNFSDHELVPECLRDFVHEKFPDERAFAHIPLSDVNETLNSVWGGKGSMARVKMEAALMRGSEKTIVALDKNISGTKHFNSVSKDMSVDEFLAAYCVECDPS